MTDYRMDAEAGKYEVKAGVELSATVIRAAESWQFFAFIFAAVVTLALTLLDEIPDERRLWRIATKVLVFLGLAYLTLVNARVRNALVRLLGAFKKERH